MAFKVGLTKSAEKDLTEAIDYYYKINKNLSKRFYDEFIVIQQLLESEPFFEVKYHSVRTLKLKSFPYLVHFICNETQKSVVIIAIVFGKQNKTKFTNRI